ncbi:MAG: ABC transporter permease, partial [Aquificaceae bacterium]
MRLAFPLTIIGLFLFLALFADFVAPYPYALQDRRSPFHPPTKIHLFKEGKPKCPYVNLYRMKDPLFKVYQEDKEVSCNLRLFGKTPYGYKLLSVEEPCKLYLLGTDKLGRDILSRIVYGSRVSLTIGLVG